METSHGYMASTIKAALVKVGAKSTSSKRLPSEQRIREYAKQHNLYSFKYGGINNQVFLVHESRIEELVKGMGIDVDAEELCRTLEQLNESLYGMR